MRKIKLRRLGIFSLAAFIIGLAPINCARAENAQPGAIVINEVAWAGTAASASDEWIELYNNTANDIDLTGWMIDDDNGDQQYQITGGKINAHSYFLIEDSQETTNLVADLIVNLSLNNAGDKLTLKDAAGNTIDTVNGSGGAWYAGDAAARTTMERIDSSSSDDVAANWAANKTGNGSTDRNGNAINGTPRGANSVSAAQQQNKAAIELVPSSAEPNSGDEITVQVKARDVQNLFSYGFDIFYDPAVLEYVNADGGTFLNEAGSMQTSFYAGLENNAPGKLVAAEARINENKTGVSGDGVLFLMNFKIIGIGGSSANITIGGTSFLADPLNDLIADFSGTSVSVQITVADPAQNAISQAGAQRYQIKLTWQEPLSGADIYKILRKNSGGVFVEIGTTNGLDFIDSDEVKNGGRIIPGIIYEYQIVAIKNGAESLPVALSFKEIRGIRGDNNRSDRVDGRDLQHLAQHFAETTANAAFDALIDTTYDGRIDGNDLIDIGANWALNYTQQ